MKNCEIQIAASFTLYCGKQRTRRRGSSNIPIHPPLGFKCHAQRYLKIAYYRSMPGLAIVDGMDYRFRYFHSDAEAEPQPQAVEEVFLE
jgi:hypothetical protein